MYFKYYPALYLMTVVSWFNSVAYIRFRNS